MTGRALTDRTGAVRCRREGRRQALKVAAPFREWARRHQSLLRDAFRYPNTQVDLTDGVSRDDLEAIGVVPMDDGTLAHPIGDEELVRLLLMPRTEALAICAARRRRMQREQHGLGRAQ